MPGRTLDNGSKYRYGFNGKENDNEVKGEGNQQDYGMRIYDPRLGRFLSVDPLSSIYSYYTPYQFAGNSPIANIDLDGNEPEWYVTVKLMVFVAKLKVSNAGENLVKTISQTNDAANNNYGRFKQGPNAPSIQDQVNANKLEVLKGKVQITAQLSKGLAVGMTTAATPFIATAAGAALPSLFAAPGVSSYLVNKTINAAMDASAQKTVTGEVDWLDIASDYLPVKPGWAKAVVKGLQASTDYTTDGGLKSIFGFGNNKKDVFDAAVDAAVPEIAGKLFGNFNKALEEGFKKKGLKGEKLVNAMGEIIKAQASYIQNVLETAVEEEGKKLNNGAPKN